MPNLTIINLTPGDTQRDLIEKINQNFDSIVSAGGGPQGPDGPPGPQGPIGQAGPKGDQGVSGLRGTRWFISSTNPSASPTNSILIGDYWVNDSKEVFIFTESGFITTGVNLQADDIFTEIPSITGPGGLTNKSAVVQSSPFPETGTFVLSDNTILGPLNANLNYAKFLISTEQSNGFPILEFGKDGVGTFGNNLKHPNFSWLAPGNANYGIKFTVPQDNFTVESGENLTLRSTSGNIFISGNSTSLFSSSTLTLNSGGSMFFSAGSSPITITSSNINLTSNSFSSSIPISVFSTIGGSFLASFSNFGSGGGINVNLTGASSPSRFLFNLKNLFSSTEFYVRSDGKVKMDKTNFAYSVVDTAPPSYSVGATGFYSIGPSLVTNGNKIVISAANSGIAVPTYTGSTGYGGWGGDFLGIGESIEINVFGISPIIGIQRTTTGITGPVFYEELNSRTLTVTILRTASSDWSVFYEAQNKSGILN